MLKLSLKSSRVQEVLAEVVATWPEPELPRATAIDRSKRSLDKANILGQSLANGLSNVRAPRVELKKRLKSERPIILTRRGLQMLRAALAH